MLYILTRNWIEYLNEEFMWTATATDCQEKQAASSLKRFIFVKNKITLLAWNLYTGNW